MQEQHLHALVQFFRCEAIVFDFGVPRETVLCAHSSQIVTLRIFLLRDGKRVFPMTWLTHDGDGFAQRQRVCCARSLD